MSHHTKIALITGAAKRVGQVIALELAAAGWDIAIHYGKSKEEASSVIASIEKMGRRVIGIEADLANEQEVRQILPNCISQLGIPNCLVNNAALFEYDAPDNFQTNKFESHLKVNLMAPLILSEQLYHLYQQSVENLEPGVIIHLLDQKLSNLNPDFMSYTLSKAGLETAMKMQAMQFAPKLRVVGLAPGITMVSGDQTLESFREAHQMTPMQRSSTPADIAQGVLYLCQAQSVTGTTLQIDGGQHLYGSKRDVMFLTND